MKKVALSALLSFGMVVAAAAQTGATSPSSSSTDQNTSSTSTSSTGQSTSSTSTTSNDQGDFARGTTAPVSKDAAKADSVKKANLTGCVQSQGSGYALVDKKHPNGVQLLTSEDLSAHVGHKVQVKGTWEAAGNTANAATPENPQGVSTSNTGAGATSAKHSEPEKNPYSTPVGNNSGTADMTPVGGNSGSSNASALPQSDQSANQAIRVSEVKMKSDKCEMPAGATK
jgi:hypothetical protein